MKANHHPTSLTLLESMMGLAIFSIAPWAELNKHSASEGRLRTLYQVRLPPGPCTPRIRTRRSLAQSAHHELGSGHRSGSPDTG